MKNEDMFLIVNNILLNEWDPIGVNSNPNLHDEYEHYVMPIINQLMTGITTEGLADFLYKIVEEDIGMLGNFNTCYKVADILKKVVDDKIDLEKVLKE